MVQLLQILNGPLNFLQRDAEELRRIVPDAERSLPPLQKIYLEDDAATPRLGFPVLVTDELQALERAFEQYITQEEEVEIAILQRASFDSQAFQGAWESYRLLLMRAAENVTTASYGRSFPAIFWLWHSGTMARVFRESPKRYLRRDLTVGREHGDALKYRIFQKVIDRLTHLNYELAQRLSSDTDEEEELLFPALFTRMRDNVLILTEEHVSPNLAELTTYFNGCLHLDGRDFRTRLMRLVEWYADELRSDVELARLASVMGMPRQEDPRSHLTRRGMVAYLATRPGYDEETLLSSAQVQVWESLLVKLKEFELLQSLRRSTILCEREGQGLVGRVRAPVGSPSATERVRLSPATRPLDFMAPWVVDPVVSRFGLIYDISDFTETVTLLRRSGALEQDRSFRMMFRFQRKVNRLASQHRAKLEKYLGDGAFYSSREAHHLMALALLIQRSYREALTRGFPFSRGLRIALNHGQYRMLPIRIGVATESERYEFFGHGVVELTRLTTGKGSRDIEEIKNLLITYGYPETTVNRFFAPMLRQNIDVVDRTERTRGFYAYINENNSLVNEGIVATGEFINLFAAERGFERVFRLVEGDRTWIACRLEMPGQSLLAAIRKLGVAQLKGLDSTPVYEVTDASLWGDHTLLEIRGGQIVELIEREFRATLGA